MIRSFFLASLLVLLAHSMLLAQPDARNKYWNVAFGPNFSMDGQIYAVEVAGQAIYIGGSFTHVAGIAANHIAKFENGAWSSLGSGVDGEVHALKAFTLANQQLLYVGGSFHRADTIVSPGFALWTSNNWYPLGAGLDPLPYGVYAIAVDPAGNPYAAGSFVDVMANGDTLRNIAHWDGSAWKPLGGGVTNWRGAVPVFALQMVQDTLYAGGFFDYVADHLPAKGVARWANNQWSAVGQIDSNEVHVTSLAIYKNELYAAGEFTTIGNDSAQGIARWDGTQWHSLGDDPGFWIGALTTSGNALYASHFDVSTTGAKFNNIAGWYGGPKWGSLGNGISEGVTSLAAMPYGGVIAAGYFDTAGMMPAHGLASWLVPEAVEAHAQTVSSTISIYPEPFAGEGFAQLKLEKADDIHVVITDLLGRQVAISQFDHLSAGDHRLPIKLDHALAGTYFLRITGYATGLVQRSFIVVGR